MKKVRCPKCDTYITFDETKFDASKTLVFECPDCKKQFKIRLKSPVAQEETEEEELPVFGKMIVVENVFHYRQEIPLHEGDNVFGRYVKGSSINAPIETVDPSIDTTHCIVSVKPDKRGNMQFILRDAPSNTGTFYMNECLKTVDRVRLSDGDIITIGATTLIIKLNEDL